MAPRPATDARPPPRGEVAVMQRDPTRLVCMSEPVKRVLLVEDDVHLSEILRHHEAEEERLFGEAFYTDLGGRSS